MYNSITNRPASDSESTRSKAKGSRGDGPSFSESGLISDSGPAERFENVESIRIASPRISIRDFATPGEDSNRFYLPKLSALRSAGSAINARPQRSHRIPVRDASNGNVVVDIAVGNRRNDSSVNCRQTVVADTAGNSKEERKLKC